MNSRLEFRRGDASAVMLVGSLLAGVLLASRLIVAGGEQTFQSWMRPLLIWGMSLLLTTALTIIQRMRPTNSASAAATVGLLMAIIPMMVEFSSGMPASDTVARHVINVAAVTAASMLIYALNKKHTGNSASAGASGVTA